jgi:hypothetical protein
MFDFTFNVHVPPEALNLLVSIHANQQTILANQETIMASIDEVRAEIAEVKQNLTDQADALSTIVAKIAALEAVIAGGLTAEQADEVLAEVRAIKEGTQAVEDSMRAAGTTA